MKRLVVLALAAAATAFVIIAQITTTRANEESSPIFGVRIPEG
jgi:hypothetical protein